ncbi:MAG: aminotransferase class I/II-fold pyridoxal phosphate-dependent enzyme [Lachnospiraceae bacterium]|nr:aminotransferase class I/II-fold pyridoxal phosphate-dependent enzyme [Lachnospiraceae bacterium]
MIHRHGGDIYTYGNVIDFSANINFRGMPASVREAARGAVDASEHYPDPDCRVLRRALARREASFYGAQDISPENLICGNGAAELMFALAAACRPKRALLAVPSFFEYEQALSAVGCEISRFGLKPENQFALGEDFLEAAYQFSEKTVCMKETAADTQRAADRALAADLSTESDSMIILGNPNNPTGQLIEKEILVKLADLCRERRILLVLDESFIDFLSEEDWRRTIFGSHFQKYNPYLFVIRSFTKMYAMPGIRFGYGLSTDRQLLEHMRRLMQPWNVSTIAQEAAAAAASEEVFARESAAAVAQNREEMMSALQKAGFAVFPSCANFLLLRAPQGLSDACLKEGFLIRDCGNFPGLFQTGDGWGYFRVCVRSREENEALLRVISPMGAACPCQ